MKKGQLKALFIEAKGTGQKYIGVMIQTEGSSEPEVIKIGRASCRERV